MSRYTKPVVEALRYDKSGVQRTPIDATMVSVTCGVQSITVAWNPRTKSFELSCDGQLELSPAVSNLVHVRVKRFGS